jgi:hypothetical protein
MIPAWHCRSCGHWQIVPDVDRGDDEPSGECRWKPPVVIPAADGVVQMFPRTTASTWCGEWTARMPAGT